MTSSAFDPAIDNLVIASRKEIVFIEDNVADYQTIAANAGAGRKVVILDSSKDGLQQIADAMKGLSGIDAVHVVTHGSEGRIVLGTLTLDQATAAQHQDVLAAIGSSMSADGDIMFYGCSVGAGQGADLIGQLAIATGADVAASNNLTGDTALGGDWNLEVAAGSVETPVLVDTALAAQYHHLLGVGKTIAFDPASTPFSFGYYAGETPQNDVSYLIGGATSIKFDGETEGVGAYDAGYITFGATSIETKITISLSDAQVFTPTFVDLNHLSTSAQTLVFTGLNASGTPIVSQEVDVDSNAFAAKALTGFTDIKTLVITPKTGLIKYFQMDNLVLSSVGPSDTTPPTLAITSNKSTVLSGDTAAITFTFSEDPGASFTFADVAVSGGTLGALSGSGFTRFATFTPGAGINGSAATISVDTNKYADAANNFNTTSSSLSLTVDTVTPTVTITSNPSTLKAGDTAYITFTFSEDPGASFTAADVVVSNGSIGAITGSGMTRNATFTPSSGLDGAPASITVTNKSYADAAGNLGAAGASPSITVDNVIPNAPTTPVLDPSTDKGVSSSDNITNWTTLQFTGSAEGGVTTVKLFDGATQIGSGSVTLGPYSITTSPLAPGVHTITARAYDAAGNESSPSGSVSVTVDTAPPTVSVSSNPSVLTAGGTADVTFTFSDDPGTSFSWDGSAGDLTVSGGTLSAISGTGMTRTATFTPNANLDTGTATIGVKANSFSDTAGNTNATTASTSLTYDTKIPTLTVTSDKPSLKIGETAIITFSFSDDPGAGFDNSDITVSGGTLTAISTTGATRTATFTPNANTDAGSASISVSSGAYHDLAGNDGAASNNLTLSYDTLAPSTPSTPALAAGDDSGASNSDGVTNDDPLSFSGSAVNGTTVRLYDGVTEVGHATASGGAWTIPVAGLAEGSHTLTAIAYDTAGNASTASGALALTVDRTAPSTTVASAALSNDSGASDSDMVTRIASQTISGTLSASLAAGERVMVSLDNGASWNPATASVGANTWELAGVTLAGSGTLKVKVEDLAGNGGTVYAHGYILDTTPPAAPSTPDLDAASDSGPSNTDNATGVTLPSFSGTAEIGATVRLFDGVIEIGSDVAEDGTWHVTTGIDTPLTARPGNMPHYITAIATDIAGNSGTNSPALEVAVLAAPTTTVAGMALSSDSGVSGDFITNASSQTVSGTLSANLPAGERVQVSLNGGASWSDATASVGSNAWSIAATLAEGDHDIKVRLTNDVDVSGPVHTQAYTLDSVKPAVAITSDVAQLKAGDTATITFTFTEDPGTSFDGADISVSGGTLSALSGTGTTRTAVFTPDANVNSGTASISIAADKYEDIAGNTGLAGATPSISFDTLAPNAPSAPDLDANSDKGDSSTDNLTNLTSLTFTGTAEAGATVKLYDSDGSTEIGSGTATGGNWTIATSTLGEDSHTVTAKVFDAAGNVSAVSGPTTVTIDTTKPTLVISSDVSQLKIGETATVTFTFSEDPGATFTWNGTSGDVTVSGGTLSAISGTGTVRTATFTPTTDTNGGTAGISVSAGAYRDAAGNDGTAGATPSLHFDTLAPGAPSTPDLDTASDTGSSDTDNFTADTTPTFSGTAESGATVTLYDGATAIGSVVAAGGTWQITSDRALSAGGHTITAKAVDAAGNAGAASSGLTVQVITSGPATGVKDLALSLDSGTAGDFVTNTAAQTISGLLDAVLAAGERVQVSLDGGTAWNDAVSSAGSDAWSIAAALASGAHDIKVRVIDAIDNTGPVHTQAYTLDSVKPAVVITSDVSQLKIGQTAAITFTFSEDPGSSFDAGDIVVSGGTLSAIAGSGLVRTAVFTPTADTNAGTAGIGVKVDSYEDAAGNLGTAGASPSLSFDTLAPAAPSAPDLHKDSDSGSSDSDDLTHDTALVLTGTAENGATVRLYDSDGSTEIGHATAAGGVWTITTSALGEGSHAITAKSFDAAGNASTASGAITVTVDTSNPAALAAPTLAAASDSGTPGDAITKVKTPTFSGSAEALAQVTLYDGATVIGSIQTDADGAWQITAAALADGVHAIGARQVDLAGNESSAGAVFSLTVDTVAPAAPAAPLLKASSDTGSVGDGVTENAIPVIEGTALADTLVTLYETVGGSKLKLGAAMADGSGKWSLATTGLSIGTHLLSATQTDAAGNESAASAGFTLRIAAPPIPIDLVDGMPVTVFPISLPGNVPGTAVSIPVVGAGRLETSGQAGVADIPLVKSSQGGTLLLAQLAPGYGLSASGANLPATNAGEILIAAIKAATPGHAPSDQGHLTGNGQSFLAGLGSAGSLLVETVKPVSSAAPEGVLTLSGPAAGAGQSTALVIDAGGLAAGATIALQQLNFAAVIGAANVTAGSGMILTGDAASQHFTVAAGGSGSVFAGGGSDTLSIAAPPAPGTAPAAGVALLHGGAANDAATFSGVRADYNLEFHNGYVMVSTKAAPDVKAMVVNVEQLQFSDASIAVQNNADMGTLAGIYQTVLGRQADVMGIEYWANVHQAGASWGAIALSMITSNEHAASHDGFNGVAAHDLALLYAAIFNREADAGGMAYWTAALGRGITLEQVASSFVESAEMVGHQRAATDWDFFVG